MNETTQNTYGTPYTQEAVAQESRPDYGPTIPRFSGATPESTPEKAQEPEKTYTLKRLQSSDIFPMLRILSKIGVSDIKECFSSPEIMKAVSKAQASGEDVDLSSVGVGVVFEIAGVIIDNLPKCEQEIYVFLSRLSGMKPEEIMEMDAVVFFEMIVDVIKKPEFKDFIKVVSGLLK